MSNEEQQHPTLGRVFGRVTRVENGKTIVVSPGYVIDESTIKAVPDGTSRLNETHGVFFPIPEPGPVKMQPPAKSQGDCSRDEKQPFDTPEFLQKHRFGTGISPEFVKLPDITSPEYRQMVKSNRALEYDTFVHTYADPMEQTGVDCYRVALQNRAEGLPYDGDIIALHQSSEWRDTSFRARYYEKLREKK